MSDPADADLQLKKRARRRLVGAIAFAGLAAVVLPMIMDDEPKQQVQDVQIRIPGQEQAPSFNAKVTKPVATVTEPAPAPAPVAEKAPEKSAEKAPAAAPPVVVAPKPIDSTPAKSAEKKVEAEKPAAKANDAQRAAALLAGKAPEPANAGGQYVILIGAFSNPANVKQLQTKIGELGINVYTESLDSPAGKKIRVRAGPFVSADAADKALEKMKRIGVNGVVAARQ